jgi:hypothetical protein
MASVEGQKEPIEATEPEPARSPSAAPKKKKKKSKAPPPPPPMTEEEIDSPTKQTLGMLGVIGIMTIFMWVFARGGCNYHPPKETRDPRKVDLVDLARDPKDAALEFELRWSMKAWEGALELAKGPMVEQVKQQQAACDADPKCAQRASELRGSVQATAQLLERDMTTSVSRVITVGTGGGTEKHIIRVERDGPLWKTVSRVVDDGTFKPKPPQQMMMPPGQLLMRQPGMPEPASSAGK